ncbi:MAG: efflux RND transporter permease subunit [Acidimicrobiia bacterium]
MKAVIRAFARAVRTAPFVVLIAVIVSTVGFGAAFGIIAPETATGNEGFAPDNAEIAASERIGELFGGDSQISVFQVIVRSPGGNVISQAGLDAVNAITAAVQASDASQYLVAPGPGQPPVVSYIGPVYQALAVQGIDPSVPLGDAAVQDAFRQALASPELPDAQRGQIVRLLSQGSDPAAARAQAGLVLMFIDPPDTATAEEAFDRQIEIESTLSEAIDGVSVEGVEIRPFSFGLLFGDQDEFLTEVGTLFGAAMAIIVVILLFVYTVRARGAVWLRPTAVVIGLITAVGVYFGTSLEGVGGVANAAAAGVVVFVVARAVLGAVSGAQTVTRSARRALADMVLTIVTIVMAIVWMQGIGALLLEAGVLGSFNQVTQIVPVLLIGLGVDYAIHLTARYREELGEGGTVDQSIGTAIGTVGVALTLATLTTAIGFLTNVFNPVPALKDFGILSSVGIVASFVLMLTFVPAVRELLDRRAERKGVLPVAEFEASGDGSLSRLIEKTSVLADRTPVTTVIVALVLGGLGVWGLTQLETRFSFTDFLPEDSPVVETLSILTEEFGGGFGETSQVLVEADAGVDLADAAAHNAMVDITAALAAVPDVVSFETPNGPVAQANSPIGLLQQLLAPGPDGNPAAPAEILGLVQELGLGPDLAAPAGADLTPLYQAVAGAVPEQAANVMHFDGDRLDAVLFDISTQAGEAGADELRVALVDAFGPLDPHAEFIPTSDEIISAVIVDALASSQTQSLLITLVIATVVLMVSFWIENRRPFLGVITMAPVALVVFWTYGLMYATGIPFGPVTATLAALAVGIGVPFTIHIARRFEEDRNRFETLGDALRSTTRHTGAALAGSAFTTMAGFGILMSSTLTPFQQMGQVTVYAIGLSLIGAILVLPSLLALWEGWHRRRGDAVVEHATESVV